MVNSFGFNAWGPRGVRQKNAGVGTEGREEKSEKGKSKMFIPSPTSILLTIYSALKKNKVKLKKKTRGEVIMSSEI